MGRVSTSAHQLLCTLLSLLPNQNQKKLFQIQLRGFLRGNRQVRPHHHTLGTSCAASRFYNQYHWNTRALMKAVQQHILQQLFKAYPRKSGRKPTLNVLVDLTTLRKEGQFKGLPVSYFNGKYGLHLVVVYLLIGKVRFPWSFAVWKGKGYASESKLAVGMIKSLCHQLQGHFHLKVLADSGFDNQYFLKPLSQLGLTVLVGTKGDRKVGDKKIKELFLNGSWVKLNTPELQVTVAWFERRYPTGETERRYVMCNQPLTAKTLVSWGKLRWRIEAFFKAAKGRFGLDQFGQRTLRGAIRFIFLSLLAFILTHTVNDYPNSPTMDWGALAFQAARSLVLWLLRAEFLVLQGQLFSSSELHLFPRAG